MILLQRVLPNDRAFDGWGPWDEVFEMFIYGLIAGLIGLALLRLFAESKEFGCLGGLGGVLTIGGMVLCIPFIGQVLSIGMILFLVGGFIVLLLRSLFK